MQYAVTYELPYMHRVMVGVDASSKAQALELCRQAFDEAIIWDNTTEMPLLFDDYEEGEDGCLAWSVQEIEAFPEPDGSVLELQRRESAFAACRALIGVIRSSRDTRGSIDPGDLDEVYGLAIKATPNANTTDALLRLSRKRLVVVLEGGLVDAIVSDSEMDLDVAVIEYDTQGFEDDEVIDVDRKNGKTIKALARLDCVTKAGIDLDGIFNQLHADTPSMME